jgi:hypothetical protein
MKVGIMQPYLFPYIGYFQLIKAVDTFVIHDDVQYIKGGWINRNRVLLNKTDYLYTFSLQNDSSSKHVNQRYFTPDFKQQCQKFMRVLQTAYGNAPYFERTQEMVKNVFKAMSPENIEEDIAVKIGRSVRLIASFLDLDTNFMSSSSLEKDEQTEGEDRVLEIAHQLNAETYINAIGGKELYNPQKFNNEGIELYFIQPKKIPYRQFPDEFVPWLSIIDVCMFNSREEINELLASYSLIQ